MKHLNCKTHSAARHVPRSAIYCVLVIAPKSLFWYPASLHGCVSMGSPCTVTNAPSKNPYITVFSTRWFFSKPRSWEKSQFKCSRTYRRPSQIGWWPVRLCWWHYSSMSWNSQRKQLCPSCLFTGKGQGTVYYHKIHVLLNDVTFSHGTECIEWKDLINLWFTFEAKKWIYCHFPLSLKYRYAQYDLWFKTGLFIILCNCWQV